MSEEIRDAAEKAAKLFREYYHIHMAKTPPDVEKARRNGDMCSLIEAALAAPVSPTREDVARAIADRSVRTYTLSGCTYVRREDAYEIADAVLAMISAHMREGK